MNKKNEEELEDLCTYYVIISVVLVGGRLVGLRWLTFVVQRNVIIRHSLCICILGNIKNEK